MRFSRVRKGVGRALAAAAVAATALSIASPAEALINTAATPLQLAQALATDPTVITGASFVTKPPTGTPTAVADSGSAMTGFPVHGTTYTILSTGNAAEASNAPQSNFASTNNGGGNVKGNTDFDVVILKVDINVPTNSNCATVGVFRFLSEEYPEFVGSQYNDGFVAQLDQHGWSTNGSVITAPGNFASDPNGNVVSVNATGATSMTAAEANGTVYDGATEMLSASVPVTPGAHSVYFSIFDQGDQIYDSTVFLDNFRLSNVTPGSCVPGAKAALRTTKTADAPQSSTGATNGYTIKITNPNNTPIQLNTIHDTLPTGFTYQTGSTSGVTFSNPSISGQTLTWTGPWTVPANSFVTLHFRVTVSSTPGTYFNSAGGNAGTVNVSPANNVAPIKVVIGTTLKASPAVAEVGVPTSTAYAFNLKARLTLTSTGFPIAGQPIDFTVGGNVICAGVLTDPFGEASCLALLNAADITLNFGYTASYNGNATYAGSSDQGPLLNVLGSDLP